MPLFDGVLELIARDVVPSGTRDNLADHARFTQYARRRRRSAPHRALRRADLGRPADRDRRRDGAERILADLADLGGAAIVGEVLDGPAGTVFVR